MENQIDVILWMAYGSLVVAIIVAVPTIRSIYRNWNLPKEKRILHYNQETDSVNK